MLDAVEESVMGRLNKKFSLDCGHNIYLNVLLEYVEEDFKSGKSKKECMELILGKLTHLSNEIRKEIDKLYEGK